MKTIVVMAALRTLKGKGPELEKLVKEIVPMVKKEKGTLEWTLYRSETDPDRFCVFEKYVDKKAIEYHVSADYFKEFGRKSAPLLVGPVDFGKIRYWNNVE